MNTIETCVRKGIREERKGGKKEKELSYPDSKERE